MSKTVVLSCAFDLEVRNEMFEGMQVREEQTLDKSGRINLTTTIPEDVHDAKTIRRIDFL